MKNHTFLLDHHRRSHYDTITIGPVQLNNSQSVNSFDSLVEKFNMQRSPMCLFLKVKRPVPMRSMKKVFTENSVLQIDR